MAQFDVYQMPDSSLVLDLQSDALYFANTRVVAPLYPKGTYEKPISRANPDLEIDGKAYTLLTHFLSAVPTSELRQCVTNLEHEQYAIKAALDVLFLGF